MNRIDTAQLTPGTRVFVRCDIDVPIENNQIFETFRLESSLTTLKYLIEKQTRLIIAGHMKDGQTTQILKPFFDQNLGPNTYKLLENLRFMPGEKGNNEDFAKELSSMADIYVNESFATSHREHASIVGVPKMLPAYAGFRLYEEISTLSSVIQNPARPLITIVGGAKIESKLPVINKFLEISDAVLLGGVLGMEWKEIVPEKLLLPKDYVGELDLGPKTVEGYKEVISNAKSVIWAGPLGQYEQEKYMEGTKQIASAIIDSGAYSIVGGGDTTAVLNKLGLLKKFNFASTGGGAMLEFLVKGTLPGLEVLA